MKKIHFSFSLISALVLSGCNSLPLYPGHSSPPQSSSWLGNTPGPMTLEGKIQRIITNNEGRVNTVLVKNGQNYRVDASLQLGLPVQLPVSGTVQSFEVDFQLTKIDGTAYFAPGEYVMQDPRVLNSNAVFSAFVADTLSQIAQLQKDSEVRVKVKYIGQADGLPFRKNRIYRGEFGDIELKEEQVTINGRPTQIRLVRNQRIDNAKLALLRAWGVHYWIHEAAQEHNILSLIREEFFDIRTHRNVGDDYRQVNVVLEIRKRPLRGRP